MQPSPRSERRRSGAGTFEGTGHCQWGIVNRADLGDLKVKEHCEKEVIPIPGEIPYDPNLARLYSRGVAVLYQEEKCLRILARIWNLMESQVEVELQTKAR